MGDSGHKCHNRGNLREIHICDELFCQMAFNFAVTNPDMRRLKAHTLPHKNWVAKGFCETEVGARVLDEKFENVRVSGWNLGCWTGCEEHKGWMWSLGSWGLCEGGGIRDFSELCLPAFAVYCKKGNTMNIVAVKSWRVYKCRFIWGEIIIVWCFVNIEIFEYSIQFVEIFLKFTKSLKSCK